MGNEQSLVIAGPEGELDCLIAQNKAGENDYLAIVCHPHSLYGGTMDNKVVYIATRAFQEKGFDTLRFNFRGVGKSEGKFAEGIGEQEDVITLVRWAHTEGYMRVLLCGFSFGSYVSTAVASQWQKGAMWVEDLAGTELSHLVSIAPPVNHFPFDSFGNVDCPWLVVHGEEDEVVPVKEVVDWASSLNADDEIPAAPKLVTLPGVTHFFHGQLTELKQHLLDFL